MTRAMVFLLVGLVPSVALANPVFLNPTQTEYQILLTLPNGEKSANTIGKSSQNMAYVSVTTPAAPKFAAEVQDELGTTVWKGQVKDELNHVLAPDGKGGLQVWQAGFYSGRTDVPAACVVNLTGDALKTFDAVGHRWLRGPLAGPESFR